MKNLVHFICSKVVASIILSGFGLVTSAFANVSLESLLDQASFEYCSACGNSRVSEALKYFETNLHQRQVLTGTKTTSSGEQISVTCNLSYRARPNTLWGWASVSCSDNSSYTVLQTIKDTHQGVAVLPLGDSLAIGLEHHRGDWMGIDLPAEQSFVVIDSVSYALQRVLVSVPESDRVLSQKRSLYDLHAYSVER